MPQGLIVGAPISQYASYSAMFCLLHSNIGKEQHEKHLCNPSSHYGDTENSVIKHAPHISMHEIHDASNVKLITLINEVIVII